MWCCDHPSRAYSDTVPAVHTSEKSTYIRHRFESSAADFWCHGQKVAGLGSVRAGQVAGMVVDGRACPNDISHVVNEGSHFAGMDVNVL
jgi:hypothetical protein